MRLSDWQATLRGQKLMTGKVATTFVSALELFGAGLDSDAWVAWGDDPEVHYSLLVIGDAGLIVVVVRVNVPLEGPRASAKVVRWGRVAIGELSVDVTRGHRQATAQVDNYILTGVDEDADRIGAFIGHVLMRIDGRTPPASRPAAGDSSSTKQNVRSDSVVMSIELPAGPGEGT
ncbi:MAG: hypothetical protein ACHQ15_04525 [Candidatus Limnocylindrales bacterium]